MAQRITTAWQDNISSFRANEQGFITAAPGRIFGFNEYSLALLDASNITIDVDHSGPTLLSKVDNTNTLENDLGLHITRNGSMVIEDSTIVVVLPINFTAANRVRYWLVANHSWSEVPGGASCTYSVIASAESATTTYNDPVLTTPATQTAIMEFDVGTTAEGRGFADIVMGPIHQFSGGRSKTRMLADLDMTPKWLNYESTIDTVNSSPAIDVYLPYNEFSEDLVITNPSTGIYIVKGVSGSAIFSLQKTFASLIPDNDSSVVYDIKVTTNSTEVQFDVRNTSAVLVNLSVVYAKLTIRHRINN